VTHIFDQHFEAALGKTAGTAVASPAGRLIVLLDILDTPAEEREQPRHVQNTARGEHLVFGLVTRFSGHHQRFVFRIVERDVVQVAAPVRGCRPSHLPLVLDKFERRGRKRDW